MTSPDAIAYVPIDCGFHDRLEDAAVRGTPVALRLRGAGEERSVTARVLDVWAESGADWVRIEGIGRVRADDLLALGDVPRSGAACETPPAHQR